MVLNFSLKATKPDKFLKRNLRFFVGNCSKFEIPRKFQYFPKFRKMTNSSKNFQAYDRIFTTDLEKYQHSNSQLIGVHQQRWGVSYSCLFILIWEFPTLAETKNVWVGDLLSVNLWRYQTRKACNFYFTLFYGCLPNHCRILYRWYSETSGLYSYKYEKTTDLMRVLKCRRFALAITMMVFGSFNWGVTVWTKQKWLKMRARGWV